MELGDFRCPNAQRPFYVYISHFELYKWASFTRQRRFTDVSVQFRWYLATGQETSLPLTYQLFKAPRVGDSLVNKQLTDCVKCGTVVSYLNREDGHYSARQQVDKGVCVFITN